MNYITYSCQCGAHPFRKSLKCPECGRANPEPRNPPRWKRRKKQQANRESFIKGLKGAVT